MRKFLFSAALSLLTVLSAFSQIDTVFWFAAPDISAGHGESPVFVRLMSYSSTITNVTISIPANGGFVPIPKVLLPNSVDFFNLTAFVGMIENASPGTALNNGIKITADKPIGAIYEVLAPNNREMVSLKGSKALGTDFYTPFPTFWATGTTSPGASFSSIEIVATQNATIVLITPRTPVFQAPATIHPANVSYTVSLNAGQTYSVRDTNRTAATSLAGSIVSSDKPIALTTFSGAINQGGVLSTSMDQITNSNFTGTDFIIRKGQGSNERLYILATQNNTNIDIHGAAIANSVINWSETKEYILSDSVTYVKTNKPVYVWHVAGYGNKLSGAQVPNLYCAGTYTTALTRTSADSFAVILYVRAGFENQFALNGNTSLIPASAFAPVPGTSGTFVCARIFYSTADVAVGAPVIITNTGDVFGAGVLAGDPASGSEYAYFSEFNSYPFVEAGTNDTICANGSISLNGLVGGGSVTGNWSGSGFGTFQNGVTSLVNAYIPSDLDTNLSPIRLILSSTGPCPVQRDTLFLVVNPRPIVSASADQTVCANNGAIQLNGSVQAGSNTGIWASDGSGNFSPANTDFNAVYQVSAADTATGTVRFVLSATNIGTCAAENDTMYVTITNAPRVDAGPPTVNVCANNPNLAVTGIVQGPTSSGKWTTSGTGIFNPNNVLLNTTFQPSQPDVIAGQTTVYLTSTNNGNCLPVTDSIRVFFTPSPTSFAGNNGFACLNDATIDLAGVIGGAATTGVWTGGAGTFAPDSTNLNAVYTPTATEISNGFVQLTLTTTNNGNCTAVSDLVKFDFVTPPIANFDAIGVCNGLSTNFEDFSLQGFGTITQWQYSFGDGNGSMQQDTSYTYVNPGTYAATLIVTSNIGCKDTAMLNVPVYPNPVANFTDTLTCLGTFISVQFNDLTTVAAPDNITTWLWDFGGTGGASGQNPTYIYSSQGNYQVTLIAVTNHGCTNTAIHLVNIPSHPTASFFYNTTPGFNVGATVSFIDSSSFASNYSWSFGNGSTSTDMNPTYTYFENGTYQIVHVVKDSIGCSDTAKATLIISSVSNEISTLIPNAISPNGDGKNDVWKLPFLNLLYPAATVEIYNRWGQKIFESAGYESPWDGTYRGELLPMGNYYYILDLKDESQPDPFNGAILLVR
ncbi:MAG: domain containing protein [Bacteroidetes bacterium]|jgi:gliding motility-associated-like protein|nr:domain containing protein [Bacteroidota bacterium]